MQAALTAPTGAVCVFDVVQAAVAPAKPPLTPVHKGPQQDFPWAHTTASKLVQHILASRGAADLCRGDAFAPPCKAARLALAQHSPGAGAACPAALPGCPALALLTSADPCDASRAGGLPSGVAEWRVQIWPVPPNCKYVGLVP